VLQGGSLVCFGVGAQQFVASTPSGAFSQVAVGDNANTYALHTYDSFAICWGSLWGAATRAFSTALSAIAVGAEWVCAIRTADKRLQCYRMFVPAVFRSYEAMPTEQLMQLTARGTKLCTIAAGGRPACYGKGASRVSTRVSMINSLSQAKATQVAF
jgi:hypothetical protein